MQALAVILAAFIGAAWWPDLLKSNSSNQGMNTFNQNNQYGNNTVNIGPQPRSLNSEKENELKQIIPAGSAVVVESALGDGEAYSFASEIKSYLESQGYHVSGVIQVIKTEPIKGQAVMLPKDGNPAYVIIGSNL